ncbi:hypothetical protein KFL_009800010 [Klebsormidium nitens]|uniref:Histone H2A/H2B/H3 domain-containing protein n=1 Tax=Klebsormidium nitens TaxID=105231 RepID=A0A1Y1IQJ9_KLENI|nr:hypothetical protein KFL_009800010 [Klebsormidium nitens]|eukprot:GAQ92322.1 hypothetical protein KFL_009800010 [Klebsormidium nitens]
MEDITLEPPTEGQMDELQGFIQELAHQNRMRAQDGAQPRRKSVYYKELRSASKTLGDKGRPVAGAAVLAASPATAGGTGKEKAQGGASSKAAIGKHATTAGLFGDVIFCQAHGKRKTLHTKDLDLARRIRGIRNEDNTLPLQAAVEHGLGHKREKVGYEPGKADEKKRKSAKQTEREARERATKDVKWVQKAELQRQTRMAAERAAREAAHGPQGGAKRSKQSGKREKRAA